MTIAAEPPDPAVAAAALAERLDGLRPAIGIALGSGLGGLAGRIEDAVRVPYGQLPGWPRPTVAGHAGEVVAGRLGGVEVLGFSGRVHVYEGHPMDRPVFYVRALAELGARLLILSNAAGSVNRRFAPGELMLISDHINLMFRNPLIGPTRPDEPRFPDMSAPYDPVLRAHVREAARELQIQLHEGVYLAVTGPSYETPAEIRMVERLGADAVGMSTVPEVTAAVSAGIRCVAISCITNYAAGVTGEPLEHTEVIEVTERAGEGFQELVARSIERIDAAGEVS